MDEISDLNNIINNYKEIKFEDFDRKKYDHLINIRTKYERFLDSMIYFIDQNIKSYRIELMVKIKSKADKLEELINIRNLLVCIKEEILMKDLPSIFTFYNENYHEVLDDIFKMMNNYNFIKASQNHIPTNLLEYILIELNESLINKKYKIYRIDKFVCECLRRDYNLKLLQRTIEDIFTNSKISNKYRIEIDKSIL